MSDEKPICTIAKAETEHLLKLFKNAQTTPMIKFTADPMEKDMATIAWDDVREFQIELGKKYKFDWEKVRIDGKTGEVFSI